MSKNHQRDVVNFIGLQLAKQKSVEHKKNIMKNFVLFSSVSILFLIFFFVTN